VAKVLMIVKIFQKFNHDTHLNEILKGSAITFVLKIAGMLLGYALIFIISRNYGADGVGLYSIAINTLIFLSMIAVMGLNISILRYAGQFNQNSDTTKLKLLYQHACELSLPLSLVFALILYLCAGKIAIYLFHNSIYTEIFRVAAFILPFFVAQDINVEFIRGIKKLKISEYFRSVNRPLFTICLLPVAVILINRSPALPVYTLGIGVCLGSIYTFIFIKKHLKTGCSISKNKFSKKELIYTSFPMMITSVASFAMGNVSIFLLEIFSTTDVAGIFSVAYKIAMFINIALVVVNTISAPKFSELFWAKKYKELQVVLDHSSKLIFTSSLTMALILLCFTEFALSIFGDEFVQGKFTLIILVVGQMFNAMTGSVGIFMNMTGRQKILRNAFLLASLFNISLQIVLIPIFGIEGAALGCMAGSIAVNVFSVAYVRYKSGFRTYYSPFSKYAKIHFTG